MSRILFRRCIPAPRAAADASEAALVTDMDVADGGMLHARQVVGSEHSAVGVARANVESMRLPGRGEVAAIWTTRGVLLCLTIARSLRGRVG